MKKINKVILQYLGLSLLLLWFVSPIPIKAAKDPQTLGDLKAELAALQKKKSDNDANQKYTQEQIRAREQAIRNAEYEITKAQGEMEEAERKIEESNEQIESLKEETEKLLIFLEKMRNRNDYMEYISGASSMTDLVMRIQAVEQITSYNQDFLYKLEALIKENEELKVQLEQKQKDLEVKIVSYQATIKSLYGDLATYDKFAVDIDTQIKTMQQNVNAYSERCRTKFGSEIDSKTLVEIDDAPYNAGWLKPLNKGTITSTIGTRWGSYHNALDIGGNKEGTPVYAAASGTVAAIIWRYHCGGNMLYINVTVGGKKYTTYYYHLLNVNVSVGQTVTQSTIIGTVGGSSTARSNGGYDSCTTGAHLHFGVANGYYTGSIKMANVITPPGFPNKSGYKFNSRTDYYG